MKNYVLHTIQLIWKRKVGAIQMLLGKIDHSGTHQIQSNIFLQLLFRSLLMASINCTIPGLGIFIQSDELNECTDRKSAIHSLTTFLGLKDEFISNNPPHGCVSPCTEVTFNSEVFAFHQNSWIDTDENSDLAKERHILSFSYTTLKQEVAIVTLVYDAENFLTSLGGNLGLFLGFSCLSLLISVLKIFVPL